MADAGEWEVRRVARILGVVLHCLRDAFPDDFHRRCAFSARAIREMLARDGVHSEAVGGRFTALAVGQFEARYALQGFQSSPEPFPHIWVETEHRLIDLSPHLLPFGSPFPLVPMPALAWDRADPMPAALSYERIEVIAGDAPFSTRGAIAEEAERFVACCLDSISAPPPIPLLGGLQTLREAERAGDPWAQAAARFQASISRDKA